MSVLVRLNKYLASLGVASRRKVDDLTIAGRITINGKLAVPGDKVDPEIDKVIVDKKIINPAPPKLVYYALNKPKYVLSTSRDDRGRDTVLNYVPPSPRVFPVGRLDYESTGLIILTNDGDLALRLTHPRYHLPKTYLVTVIGKISPEKIENLRRGVLLDDGLTAPAKAEIMPPQFDHPVLKITLFEGKKRQIRRMCAALKLHILDLHRLSIGPVELKKIAPGEFRELMFDEIKSLSRP